MALENFLEPGDRGGAPTNLLRQVPDGDCVFLARRSQLINHNLKADEFLFLFFQSSDFLAEVVSFRPKVMKSIDHV